MITIFYSSYTVVGRSFFSHELGQPGELGNGVEYWRGYYQSLRPVQMGLSLNIGTTFELFIDSELLFFLTFMGLYCRCVS